MSKERLKTPDLNEERPLTHMTLVLQKEVKHIHCQGRKERGTRFFGLCKETLIFFLSTSL